jgi:ABC-type transport system involved in cytochrome c biogenesis permease component
LHSTGRFQVELESGALEPLLLYPGPRWTIFAGKLLANRTS